MKEEKNKGLKSMKESSRVPKEGWAGEPIGDAPTGVEGDDD